MNDIYSFYQLISKFQIEIPIIQRDYAQGRNNPKAQDIRKSMVTDLIAAVKDGKKLFFDFVYGRIDEYKFIPFDGQQRLTTLFLFHKYVFEKCQSCSTCGNITNCICKDILLRFSYATRQSSREFCEQLVSNSVIPSKDYHKRIRDEYIQTLKDKQESEAEIGKKADEYVAGKTDWMSGFIKNQSWFYSDWEKDPTIMGMLTMLDEIHNQFTKREINDYRLLAEKLTSGCSCPITFHFVDMGEHKLSDDTYVKMNARGKTLTPFENFKASLEQYLESKKEYDTLSGRLRDNADGKWLDLFWKVVNKEGKDNKELPDNAMMSFINRHFMNVWRCWYGKNTESENERKNLINEEIEKQKEYISFNERIVVEIPLYPTKDDFVSWDIYQNILDNCGIDECLTPIFNIWDELCEEQEHIIENSQSVWNRGKGKAKWNLYEGTKNNDNRETYPSRVAFYALLRYFEKERIGTTLAQWMRVVWNIIENSTIDSSDTYQSALSLIDKLSKNCDDIYDALANHFDDFQLGSQYHAQNQVKEEIAKAEQIRQGNLRAYEKSREDVIIEAESYAFFKGAIRFLFTKEDIGDDWEHFDTKWENAKKYFKEIPEQKNVMNRDFDNANLLKALISRFTQQNYWDVLNYYYRVFNNSIATWRYYLLNDKIYSPIHEIMMGNNFIQKLDPSQDEAQNRLYQLSNTNLLNFVLDKIPQSWIRVYHGHKAIFPSSTGVFLDAAIRDEMLHIDDIVLNEEVKVPGTKFLYGSDIQFSYQCKFFQWHREGYVRLIQDLNECKPVLRNEDGEDNQENWYWFKPTSEVSAFTKQLDCLIAQAFPEESDKAGCNDCQNKVCE